MYVTYAILWDAEVSDRTKVVYMKLRERHPKGFLWKELATICGSHAKTQRVRNELLEKGWIRKVQRLYICNNGRRLPV
jgi:NAD(P)H-flavin reductase